MKKSKAEKEKTKKYEKYVSKFTPATRYLSNEIKAFVVGGLLCVAAAYAQQLTRLSFHVADKEAGTLVTVGLIFIAQLFTGFGWFAPVAKFAGAGVIVPITGFANSMVATGMEFKSEGPVLGVGSKLFQLAGPVIVCGISVSILIGIIYYFLFMFNILT